jgi:deoxyribodipyrimidine photo-lyase
MNDLFSLEEKEIAFPTDYNSILERVDQINPVQYGKSRNFIDGAVTYLSPYISLEVISQKHVQDSVMVKG